MSCPRQWGFINTCKTSLSSNDSEQSLRCLFVMSYKLFYAKSAALDSQNCAIIGISFFGTNALFYGEERLWSVLWKQQIFLSFRFGFVRSELKRTFCAWSENESKLHARRRISLLHKNHNQFLYFKPFFSFNKDINFFQIDDSENSCLVCRTEAHCF